MMSDFSFLNDTSSSVAQRLLGCMFEREIDGKVIRVKIVETEAYDQFDVASHSYRGETERVKTMFGPAGHLYVYFTYGMHYCCNVVTGEAGHGAGVLVRAVEPFGDAAEVMANCRRGKTDRDVSNGPAKLCQALAIDTSMNGHDLHQPPMRLIVHEPLPADQIVTTTRVGISQAQNVPWRFYIKDNPYVSVK